MALTKNFKTVVEVKGLYEGAGQGFTVEADTIEEWKATVKQKVFDKRGPAAATVEAADAVLPFLEPTS